MDPWHYSLLGVDAYIVYGAMIVDSRSWWWDITRCAIGLPIERCCITHWFAFVDDVARDRTLNNSTARILEALLFGGIGMLEHDIESVGMLVSVKSGSGLLSSLVRRRKPATRRVAGKRGPLWTRIDAPMPERVWLAAYEERAKPSKVLARALKSIELKASKKVYGESREVGNWLSHDVALFVAEIRTRPTKRDPKSLLSEIWNECLGPRIIPFNPTERAALIEYGRNHPRLGRHISAWEEMRRAGSRWTTGERKPSYLYPWLE
jgi:hypothetical protein